MTIRLPFPELTPEEAAAHYKDGQLVGFSGFTPAGAAKATPRALAELAKAEHDAGRPFRIRVLAGASTGEDIDERLAAVDAISWRAPYQSSKSLRKAVNEQRCEFVDMHLSHVGQMLEFGFFGDIDVAVIEAVDVTPDGRIYLSTSSGISPSVIKHAKKIIVEINAAHSTRLAEMHDVTVLPVPPNRAPIPVHAPMGRIGTPFCACNPERIIGIVRTDEPDRVPAAREPDDVSNAIAGHIVRFLLDEMHAGRIPAEFLPLQAGVGNIANAVLGGLAQNPEIPDFQMYTEVLQDSQMALLRSGRLLGASTSAITVSDEHIAEIYNDMDFFSPRIVIRPTEISNNPGIIRRLGVIAINTVLEADIYGCANSTHVCGTQLMNGIGGSGDFVRNSYLSILVAPSIAKRGAISTIVPMCSHVDHSEHSIQILVTDQGLADLRGLGPKERSERIIEQCAHPSYRDYLRAYAGQSHTGHLRHDLDRAFELHRNLLDRGHMLP